jgi:hypothetical protein
VSLPVTTGLWTAGIASLGVLSGWVTGPARAVRARPNRPSGWLVLALVPPVRSGVVKLLGAVVAGRCPKGSAPPGAAAGATPSRAWSGQGAAEGRASTHERAATLDRGGSGVAPARPARIGWAVRGRQRRSGSPHGSEAGRPIPARDPRGRHASSCRQVGGGQDPGRQGSYEASAWGARWLGSRAVAPCPVGPPAGRGATAIGKGADRCPSLLAGWLTRGGAQPGRWGSSGARTCGS